MTWQWTIVMVATILSVPASFSVVAAWDTLPYYFELRKIRKTLRSARTFKKGKMKVIAQPQQVAAITTVTTPATVSKFSSLQSIVSNSSFDAASLKKALSVTKGVSKVRTMALTVEDEQSVEVIESQLLTLVRVFESIASSRRNDEVAEQVNEQLDVMLNVLKALIARYSDDAVTQLKMNTEFLKNKFVAETSGLQLEKK